MTKPKKKQSAAKPSPAKPKPAAAVKIPGINKWFEDNFRSLSIGVILLAALLRLILLIELPRMPFSDLHKGPDLDMNFFDQWGERIANGDIMTDTIWHPYHTWHRALANRFGIQDDQQAKVKWNEWYGGKVYHQEPLYPFLVGVANKIAGNGFTITFILQMLLAVYSIWMIIWLGKHYFNAMAGILGGLLFTLYAPGVLFDAVLLRTSFTTSLLIGILFLGEKLMQGKGKAWAMGLLGGAGYLLMTTSMMLWIPVVLRWLFIRREDIRKSWQVALAFLFMISFLIARNQVAGVSPMAASSVGPITYILSNFPKYKPEYGFTFFPEAGLFLDAAGGKMIPSAISVINLHRSFWGWVELQFKKLGAVFHWYEIPNNINSYLAHKYSLAMKISFIPYSLIAGLGLLGMLMNLKNRKTINLHIAIWSQVAIMVIFYVLCRFRIPMVAMLAIFGGYALQQIVNFTSAKRSILLGVSAVALWYFVARPVPKIPAPFVKGDLTTYFMTYYLPRLDSLSAKGDLNSSLRLYEGFVSSIPREIENLEFEQPIKEGSIRDLVSYYAILYKDLGNLYKDVGQGDKAQECWTQSDRLNAAAK